MIVQREHDDYVEWAISQLGEKSYDVQHLLAQIGLMHIATQSVVDDMRDIADED
jgi:lysine/ornithine N-monooxygenase